MNPTGKKARHLWLRRIATGGWVIAFLLLLLVWIRSYWVHDRIHFLSERFAVEESRTMLLVLRSGAGRFIYNYDASWAKHVEAYRELLSKSGAGLGTKRAWARISVPVDENDYFFNLEFRQGSGFLWDGEDTGSSAVGRERRIYLIGLPYWSLLLVLLIPAVVRLILKARRNRLTWERSRLGQCIECGYDLRATPGRCPECGWEGAG